MYAFTCSLSPCFTASRTGRHEAQKRRWRDCWRSAGPGPASQGNWASTSRFDPTTMVSLVLHEVEHGSWDKLLVANESDPPSIPQVAIWPAWLVHCLSKHAASSAHETERNLTNSSPRTMPAWRGSHCKFRAVLSGCFDPQRDEPRLHAVSESWYAVSWLWVQPR